MPDTATDIHSAGARILPQPGLNEPLVSEAVSPRVSPCPQLPAEVRLVCLAICAGGFWVSATRPVMTAPVVTGYHSGPSRDVHLEAAIFDVKRKNVMFQETVGYCSHQPAI